MPGPLLDLGGLAVAEPGAQEAVLLPQSGKPAVQTRGRRDDLAIVALGQHTEELGPPSGGVLDLGA